MNISALLKKLKGKTTFEEKAEVFDEYLAEASSDEIEKLGKFYPLSVNAVKKHRGVTRARSMLQNDGHLDPFGGIRYSTLHQLASYVASDGQEIKNPDEELKNEEGKRVITRYNNKVMAPTSQGMSKIDHLGAVKTKSGKRPYGNV